ncbi:hypothetical protein BU16DRAFT_272871 [Lophium mytilinum]|uniref:Uncharacterized protein n=1 Tax=Lophium mytilinum TaxID=390894 RepID=A0A6A6R6G8_9PEZI|nr:hypothetical protein BU16DRAFT_272871 [Lophium mytilinum]
MPAWVDGEEASTSNVSSFSELPPFSACPGARHGTRRAFSTSVASEPQARSTLPSSTSVSAPSKTFAALKRCMMPLVRWVVFGVWRAIARGGRRSGEEGHRASCAMAGISASSMSEWAQHQQLRGWPVNQGHVPGDPSYAHLKTRQADGPSIEGLGTCSLRTWSPYRATPDPTDRRWPSLPVPVPADCELVGRYVLQFTPIRLAPPVSPHVPTLPMYRSHSGATITATDTNSFRSGSRNRWGNCCKIFYKAPSPPRPRSSFLSSQSPQTTTDTLFRAIFRFFCTVSARFRSSFSQDPSKQPRFRHFFSQKLPNNHHVCPIRRQNRRDRGQLPPPCPPNVAPPPPPPATPPRPHRGRVARRPRPTVAHGLGPMWPRSAPFRGPNGPLLPHPGWGLRLPGLGWGQPVPELHGAGARCALRGRRLAD